MSFPDEIFIELAYGFEKPLGCGEPRRDGVEMSETVPLIVFGMLLSGGHWAWEIFLFIIPPEDIYFFLLIFR